MGFIYRTSVRHPLSTVAAALLVTALAAPGVVRLKLRTDGHALVPADAPEIQFDQQVRARFDVEDLIVVVVQTTHPDGVFRTDVMQLVQDLTDDCREIPGVNAVNLFSLATERSTRVRPGTLSFRTFLDPFPDTPQLLDRLRSDLDQIKLYTGTLISRDGKSTAVMVGAPPGVDRGQLYENIKGVAAARRSGADACGARLLITGAPIAEALLGTHILEDLGVPACLLGTSAAQDEPSTGWHFPQSLDELRLLIAHHVGLVPVALAVMMLVFLVSFRSLAAALLPLMEVGACLLFVFGLMGWCDVPVYLTIAVLPVILTAMGVADEIHIFSHYIQNCRIAPDSARRAAVLMTMGELAGPVVKTSLTTAVGFLSFALSPIGPVRAFGVFTAIGIIFCMLWSLTVIPALLAGLPRRWIVAGWKQRHQHSPPAPPAWLTRCCGLVIQHRLAVLALTVLVSVAAVFGARRVVIQDSWINGFAPNSDFYQATKLFNEQFLGMHMLLVRVDTGGQTLAGELDPRTHDRYPLRLPGDLVADPSELVGWAIHLAPSGGAARPPAASGIRQPPRKWQSWIESATRDGDEIVVTTARPCPSFRRQLRLNPNETARYEIRPERLTLPEVLRHISDLEDFITAQCDCAVGGVLGTADYIATANFMSAGNREEFRCIPDARERALLAWDRYEMARGPQRLRQIVDPELSEALLTIFLNDANFVDTARLLESVRQYADSELAPHDLTLGFAGDVAVSQTLIGAIVTTQLRSLAASLVGIFLIACLLGRSLRRGLYCVLPCALAVAVNFAVMGWTGIPLGVATSMFTGMTLGIGVDFAIHLIERHRLATTRGLVGAAAISDAVATAGPAIVIDALGIALGFGVLVLSQVPANARLGALLVLSIANCLVGTLVLLPALLHLWTPGTPVLPKEERGKGQTSDDHPAPASSREDEEVLV